MPKRVVVEDDFEDDFSGSIDEESEEEKVVVPMAKKVPELATYSNFSLILPKDKPFRLLINGRSGTGKTTLIKQIVKETENRFAYVLLIGANSKKETWVPKENRVIGLSEEYLSRWYDKQKISKTPCLLIFDDILDQDFKSPFWRGFVSTCRHYNVSLIFSIQYLKGTLPPALRENCNSIVCTFAPNQAVDNLYALTTKVSKEDFKKYCGEIKLGKYLMISMEGQGELKWITIKA